MTPKLVAHWSYIMDYDACCSLPISPPSSAQKSKKYQECIPVGWVPPTSMDVSTRVVSASGSGGSGWRGGRPLHHPLSPQTPLSPNTPFTHLSCGQTNTCESITLPPNFVCGEKLTIGIFIRIVEPLNQRDVSEAQVHVTLDRDVIASFQGLWRHSGRASLKRNIHVGSGPEICDRMNETSQLLATLRHSNGISLEPVSFAISLGRPSWNRQTDRETKKIV